MLIIKQKKDLLFFLNKEKEKNKTIGFVPTMGALHQGHLELVKTAKKECDIVICSIFVNPTQFNQQTDLKSYPRTIENDILFLEQENADILFLPNEAEIYPNGAVTSIDFDFAGLDKNMEGNHRPGHFNGVVMVLNIFLNIIPANNIYMGQKDFQQYLITRKLVNDFHPDTKVRMVETVREKNGLAMSSRNMRLSEKGKESATALYALLSKFAQENENKNFEEFRKEAIAELNSHADIELEYLELADANSLELIDSTEGKKPSLICIAANVEEVRLIDNLIIS